MEREVDVQEVEQMIDLDCDHQHGMIRDGILMTLGLSRWYLVRSG